MKSMPDVSMRMNTVSLEDWYWDNEGKPTEAMFSVIINLVKWIQENWHAFKVFAIFMNFIGFDSTGEKSGLAKV